MPRDRQEHGPCTQCSEGTVTCSHNYFAGDGQQIDSWEHRCSDCSYRETEAIRIDAENPPGEADPKVCPFCGRRAPA